MQTIPDPQVADLRRRAQAVKFCIKPQDRVLRILCSADSPGT